MVNKNPNHYIDVASILDPALNAGGGVYRVATRGKAVRFCQRAYALRTSLRDLAAQVIVPGQAAYTKYDNMLLRITDAEGNQMDKATEGARPHLVHILMQSAQGELTDLAGNPLTPAVGPVTVPRDSMGLEI